MPKTWAQYKRDQRARKRAAGCLRMDIVLSSSGQLALAGLKSWFSDEFGVEATNNDLVERALKALHESHTACVPPSQPKDT